METSRLLGLAVNVRLKRRAVSSRYTATKDPYVPIRVEPLVELVVQSAPVLSFVYEMDSGVR